MPKYLTLDILPGGVIAPEACLWSQRPVLFEGYGGGHHWLDDNGKLNHMIEYISKSDCYKRFGTYPDDHEMLIRIGKR